MREKAGWSQQMLADMFDWQRDAISKIERGINNLTLYDYLTLMRFLAPMDPDHPAKPLADRLLSGRRQRPE